jgi:hypothetical protein
MLLILVDFASWIDVPAADSRRRPGHPDGQGRSRRPRCADPGELRTECPDDAFAAVEYRGHWFWIDDRDLRSKRALSLLMLFFSLTETGGAPGAPLVTIPVN